MRSAQISVERLAKFLFSCNKSQAWISCYPVSCYSSRCPVQMKVSSTTADTNRFFHQSSAWQVFTSFPRALRTESPLLCPMQKVILHINTDVPDATPTSPGLLHVVVRGHPGYTPGFPIVWIFILPISIHPVIRRLTIEVHFASSDPARAFFFKTSTCQKFESAS